MRDAEQMQQELEYYKRRVDELAGENLRLDYTVSGLRHELKQKRQGFALLSELQQSVGVHRQISSIFEVAIAAISSTLGMDRTVVLAPAGEENLYRPSHWLGFREEAAASFNDLVLTFPAAFAEGSGLLVVNKSTEPTPLIEEIRAAFDLPFFVCIPVMGEDGPISLLLPGRLKEVKPLYPPLDQGDVDTLQAIAGLISASVQNMRVAVLEEMDRLKTDFFANISHEFRTPLTLTLGPLGQILEGRHGPVPEELVEQLKMMQRNQGRLLGLVNQILDLAKLEAGGMELEAAPVPDMNLLIEKDAAPFRAIAENRGIELRLSLDPEVREANLFIDREKFEKLLSNLLSNALKFTKQGRVEISSAIHQKALRLTVTDTGIGIKEDQLPHIFDRFRQADGSASREYAGTGIGLALAKEIAQLHGGDIAVYSRYGKGSTFRVTIPLGKAHLNPASVVAAAEEEPPAPADAQAEVFVLEGATDQEDVGQLNREVEAAFDADKPTIVYAEDNPDLRRHVRSLLMPLYNVFLAVDGRDGLEEVKRRRPDLVLSDQMMPNMNGRDLLEALRADAELRAVPVIFLTARAGTDARIESLEAGADDYLPKPFHSGELLARVGNLVRARSQERQLEELNRSLEAQRDDLQQAFHDLKALQTQLVQQEKMASLGALTAGIAHEIKNPLNFINNFAALSVELVDELREGLSSEKADDFGALLEDIKLNATKIEEHGRRADGIVKSMLLHSRGTTGEKQEMDLNVLLDEYVNLAYHGMRAQHAEFNVTIERDYDERVGRLDVTPQELGRVFINLLNNAFYAVHEQRAQLDGQYAPGVAVSTERTEDGIEIRIEDNGGGFPHEIKEKIFEPFFTTKPTGEGTGLGLSMSYDIITQGHGGMLSAESREGEGTEFIITLPLATSNARTPTHAR